MVYKEENLQPYLSNKLIYQLYRSYKFGYTWSGHPYVYSKKKQRFEMVQGLRLWFWYFNAAFMVLHSVFVVIRLVQVKMDDTTSLETSIAMEFMAVFYFFPAGCQISCLVMGEDLCIMENQGIAFFRGFLPYARRAYWTKSDKLLETWFSELFLDWLWYGCFGILFFVVASGIVQPGLPVFISSLLENPWEAGSIPVRALSLLVTLHGMLVYLSTNYVLGAAGQVLSFGMLPAMSHMRLAENRDDCWRTDVKWYIQMGLVVECTNSCYKNIVMPLTQIVLVLLCIYGVFAAVRMSGVFQLTIVACGVLCYLFLIGLFRYLAEYDTRSKGLLRKWSLANDDNEIRKRILRSLKPLHFKLWENFIDVPIVLTITSTIISNSITMLLL